MTVNEMQDYFHQTVAKGTIPLHGATAELCSPPESTTSSADTSFFLVKTADRTYFFEASDSRERLEWVSEIAQAIVSVKQSTVSPLR